MSPFLLPQQSLKDMKAAIDLIKEAGGRVLHLAPVIGGFVVETTNQIADALGLIPWE